MVREQSRKPRGYGRCVKQLNVTSESQPKSQNRKDRRERHHARRPVHLPTVINKAAGTRSSPRLDPSVRSCRTSFDGEDGDTRYLYNF